MTIITQQGTCKYCGEATSGYERDEVNQRWITYNPDLSVHSRDECRANQAKKKNQAKAQQVQKTQTQKYYPTKAETTTTATGININSVYFVVTKQFAELNKKLDELRASAVTKKEYQEQASIIDSVAQNVDILVKKIGYPEPKPVVEETREESEPYNNPETFVNCNKCGVKIERKLAWVTGGGSVFMCENCFPSPQQEQELKEELGIYPKHTDLQQQDINPEDWREPQTTTTTAAEGEGGWNLISQKFICHRCQKMAHNGYDKAGTKLCLDCKSDIDAEMAIAEIEEDDDANPSINQLNEEVTDNNKTLIEDDI